MCASTREDLLALGCSPCPDTKGIITHHPRRNDDDDDDGDGDDDDDDDHDHDHDDDDEYE